MTQACLQQSPFLHSVQTPGPVTSERLLVVCVCSCGAFGLDFSLLSAVCFNAQYTELAPLQWFREQSETGHTLLYIVV